MTTLAGRTALITGGASGLGRLLGAELARRGSRVILWDIDEDRLRSTTEEIREMPGARCSGYPCDVSDAHAVRDTADHVRSDVSDVAVLVKNAGVTPAPPHLAL